MMLQHLADRADLNEALNESMNTDQPTKVPASTKFIDKLNSILLGDKDIIEKCTICLDNFKKELQAINNKLDNNSCKKVQACSVEYNNALAYYEQNIFRNVVWNHLLA